ncbi:MAG: hypothetical protein KBD73_02525 [Candidatus Magasanikbacteria bacterium]|nr:hypothetical protein [Candidatus Magasanikbacteria bacterium]
MNFTRWSILSLVFRGLAEKYPEDEDVLRIEAEYRFGAAKALLLDTDESERSFEEFMRGTVAPLFALLNERYPSDQQIKGTHEVIKSFLVEMGGNASK